MKADKEETVVEVGGLVGKLMKLRGWTREEAEARVLEALEEDE